MLGNIRGNKVDESGQSGQRGGKSIFTDFSYLSEYHPMIVLRIFLTYWWLVKLQLVRLWRTWSNFWILPKNVNFLDQTCTSDEFTCDNGNCIQKKWLCDHEDDCGDGSDERKCPENKCDLQNDFACGNGYCITKRWRCDGDLDCPDATDEMVRDV